jgi:outer membrane receptor protein involved in Fe transport
MKIQKIKNKIFIVSFLLIALNSWGQRPMGGNKIGVLSGTIIDSLTKKPLEYTSVKVYTQADSSFVMGIYTDANGEFLLYQIPAGKYFAKITLLNYQSKWIRNISITNEKPDRVLGAIKLASENATELEVAKVSTNKKILETSFDKKVYNISEDLTARNGSVNDVLNNIPSVEVDQDGKISLRGDGNVTILIDGRPSVMTGNSAKSFLDALPANMVERIELVTNPSAKYDPDGTSGIINIVLKKNKLRGINGNVNVSGATGNILNGSTSLSMRNSKMNVYGTYSYRHYEGERNNFGELNRFINADSLFRLNQNRLGTDYNVGHTLKFGSDFYLKDRSILGFNITTSIGERNRSGDLVNKQLNPSGDLIAQWNRISFDPSKQKNMDANLNYKYDFKEDKGSISMEASQSFGTDTTGGRYNQKYSTPFSTSKEQQLANMENNRVSSVMLDYVRVLPKSIRIEVGAKTIIRNSLINSNSETKDSLGIFLDDKLSTFTYSYDEQIYSSYGNFAQHIGKFKYQGGVRVERSFQTPNLISQNQVFAKNYFNIFPSAFLTYTIIKDLDLTLNYSRRINRASSENLNPFTSYADPYNLRKGNPELSPEFIDSYEFGYGFIKRKLSINGSVYYRDSRSVIQRYRLFDPNGYAAITYINIDRSQSVGTELIITFRPIPGFKNVVSFNGNQIKYSDSKILQTPTTGFNWSVKYIGSIDFWKKTASLQINGKYNAPIITPQGKVQPRASLDISGEKNMKEGKWTIGFKVSDVFNTQEFRIYAEEDEPRVVQTSTFKQTTRRFYLNLAYKFGKMEVSKKGKISNENGGGGMDF